VFFQESPGRFSSAPLVLGGPLVTREVKSVIAADMDGDGDLDLVSADFFGARLSVFFQESPGSFASVPLSLAAPSLINTPNSVIATDLDGDGDQDLVSANGDGSGFVDADNLAIYLQTTRGSFDPAPLALSGNPATYRPQSVAIADMDGDGDEDLVS